MCYQLYNTCYRGIFCKGYDSKEEEEERGAKQEAYRNAGGLWPCVDFYVTCELDMQCEKTKTMYRKPEDNEKCSLCNPIEKGPFTGNVTALTEQQIETRAKIQAVTAIHEIRFLWMLTDFVEAVDLPPRGKAAQSQEEDVEEDPGDLTAEDVIGLLDRYRAAVASVGESLQNNRLSMQEVGDTIGQGSPTAGVGLGMESSVRRRVRRRSSLQMLLLGSPPRSSG